MKSALLFLCGFLLSGCNPMASVKPEVEEFKKNHGDHIRTYSALGREMRYAWSGDSKKRPVVFVHGSPGSWEAWIHFLNDSDLQNDFQLISVDRLGYGGSDPGHSEKDLAKQAEGILEVLKINQSHLSAILVGHSFGGPVIAKAAMIKPESVAGLVFVSSSVSPELEHTRWIQYPATWWPIRNLIPADLRVCNEEIMPLKGELEKMLPEWKKISARSVLIQGEKDDLVPPENLDFLIHNLRPESIVKVVRVPDLNHFVPWKRPDLIKAGILEVNHAL